MHRYTRANDANERFDGCVERENLDSLRLAKLRLSIKRLIKALLVAREHARNTQNTLLTLSLFFSFQSRGS